VPPPGDWTHWFLVAGRGGGKTFANAHYVDQYARANANARIAIIAPTLGDARKTCVEGVTGILSFNRNVKFNRSWGELHWPNGAQGTLFGAHTPDDAERLRGPQHHLVWFEEMAAARQLEDSWTNMRLGLRLGDHPRVIVSTTPKPRPLLKALLADPQTVVTRATTGDNPYLHVDVRTELYRLYEGTRIGRQELGAEILDDNPEALWSRETIEKSRVTKMPELVRIVVSVDPSVTSGGNECGITAQGIAEDGQGYLLDDLSMQGSPYAWAKQAVDGYDWWKADRLVAETNQGGEMVRQNIASIPREDKLPVAYRGVHASRGKFTRAEPISSFYQQGRIHHVGCFPELEDEMCSWQPGAESPNRLDALVHGFTDLMIAKKVIEITLV
jgi:phage terminase large subunit-like protein